MTIKLELTGEEADQLAKLIDAAIKANGIPAAVEGVPLFQKLKQAADAAAKVEMPPPGSPQNPL
jgi:hypothetical protein